MILLAHPTGNANVRAVLDALQRAQLLAKFVTTLAFSKRSHPYLSDHIRGKLRRNYDLPDEKIDIHPLRESVRLLAGPLHLSGLTRHEKGWASMDGVIRNLDHYAAQSLRNDKYGSALCGVYAYEDCAEELFQAANERNFRRVYDLPIAYWETAQVLLREEALRYPDWEPTLGGTSDSADKLARKTRELELAELVICPSQFVVDSLPEKARLEKRWVMAPFGSPMVTVDDGKAASPVDGPLRVLFAGALTQRKGLADLFAAMRLLQSKNVELVLMGSLVQTLEWYRERCPNFVYEGPRPHQEFLELMQTCHVLVLPSIVEGRALVQQEAMACALPVIATRNAGAEDVIAEGQTGFLVPIRSPEALAAKIDWCASNRPSLNGMGIAAQERARQLTWQGYGEKVLAAVRELIES